MQRYLLRIDGTRMPIDGRCRMHDICEMIGATTLDTVWLRHLGEPRMMMVVDDRAYEYVVINHGRGHYENKPVRALKPVNEAATALYHANCKPGTKHSILGDVVIVPDSDFASDEDPDPSDEQGTRGG